MITGNKGEWSELYVLFKLLGDGILYAADSNLNRIEDVYYPLTKVLREENATTKEYIYGPNIKLINAVDKSCLWEMPVQEFQKKAEILLTEIKSAKSSSFSIPEIEKFMQIIDCSKIKADSKDKSDINIVVHDKRTGLEPLLGFSIKSKLGSASTLLNAGKTTNFIYSLSKDLSEEQIKQINSIETRSKVKDRLSLINEFGCSLNFETTENGTFLSNLQVIDTALPDILAYILLFYFQGGSSNMQDLLNKVEELNPCNFRTDYGHPFYRYKIKNLLTDIALGMMAGTVWSGSYDATGGYIIVKQDGEILCYHIYNRNEFQEYLLKNTKLDTASTSRHDFGYIYKENGRLFIKLNLQVRFI